MVRTTRIPRIPHIPPKRLLFSGGGMRVIAYLGVLQVLEEESLLKYVREFCGVSAGALVATMMALGYSLEKIQRFCLEYDFTNVRSLEPDTMLQITETFGIDSGEMLEKLIHKILKHKNLPNDATFQQVPNLRIWASDLNSMTLTEFSIQKTPSISISFALRASMAFPLYYIPLQHPENGHILVDGAVFDNYPVLTFTQKEREETLGFIFESSKSPIEISDIFKYITLIIEGHYRPLYHNLIEQHRNKTVVIPCGNFAVLHFEATIEEKKFLIECGRKAMLDFLNRPQKQKTILRRISVC